MAHVLWLSCKNIKNSDNLSDVQKVLNVSRETLHRANLFSQQSSLSTAERQKLQGAVTLISTVVQLLQDRLEVI